MPRADEFGPLRGHVQTPGPLRGRESERSPAMAGKPFRSSMASIISALGFGKCTKGDVCVAAFGFSSALKGIVPFAVAFVTATEGDCVVSSFVMCTEGARANSPGQRPGNSFPSHYICPVGAMPGTMLRVGKRGHPYHGSLEWPVDKHSDSSKARRQSLHRLLDDR